MNKEISFEERVSWVQLALTSSIGPITFKHLIDKFYTAQNAVEQLPDFSKKVGRKKELLIFAKDKAIYYLEQCKKKGVDILLSCEKDFPKNLRMINDAPIMLHYKGNKKLLNKQSIAAVGSRNASIQGIALAKKMVKELSESGLVVISGLARGIDAAAHEVSLSNGTIAVVAGGIDIIYPQENADLYNKIAESGCIISEARLGKESRPNCFTYRNRIVSGISQGVLVIEAAIKSGSLITARYAAAQGRDVYAVPGHPYDMRSAGANYLIKNGAYLVESARNIIDLMGNTKEYIQEELFEVQNVEEENIEDIKKYLLNKLGGTFISINEVCKNTSFSITQINSALAELELSNLVELEGASVKRI